MSNSIGFLEYKTPFSITSLVSYSYHYFKIISRAIRTSKNHNVSGIVWKRVQTTCPFIGHTLDRTSGAPTSQSGCWDCGMVAQRIVHQAGWGPLWPGLAAALLWVCWLPSCFTAAPLVLLSPGLYGLLWFTFGPSCCGHGDVWCGSAFWSGCFEGLPTSGWHPPFYYELMDSTGEAGLQGQGLVLLLLQSPPKVGPWL